MRGDSVQGRREHEAIVLDGNGQPELDYDLTVPTLLLRYFPTGMLGLGLTALLASFMSGMAGNVTAFNTVWTYDIYQAYLRPQASDAHYLMVGRMATVFGIAASVADGVRRGAVQQHHGRAAAGVRVRQRAAARDIPARDVLEADDRARRVLGLLDRHARGRAAPRADAAGGRGRRRQGRLARRQSHTYPSEMAQNFWTAIDAWTVCFVVTIVVSADDAAAARTRAGRPRVFADRRGRATGQLRVVPAAGGPRRDRAGRGRRAEPGVLLMGLDVRLPVG